MRFSLTTGWMGRGRWQARTECSLPTMTETGGNGLRQQRPVQQWPAADGFIEALGGPSALKIPGAIMAALSNGAVTIIWTGGVPLQSADDLAGQWTTVNGTAGQSTYTPSAMSAAQFYRPQIP